MFIMNNEGKAKEICGRDVACCDFDCVNCASQYELVNLRAMAKWKDQCFNDVIKRLRETYERDEQALFILQIVESRYNAKF